MVSDMKRLEELADSLGVEREEGESELNFRKRVARAVLDEHGDPIHATEILVKKDDYHDFDQEEESLSFLLSMAHSREKEAEFRSTNDTYFNIPWIDFNDVLRHNGFERLYSYIFKAPEEKFEDEFAIWADYEKGILLQAESYLGRKNVNSASINLELNTPKKLEELDLVESRVLYRWGLNHCSHQTARGMEESKREEKDDTFIIDRDVREGLVAYLGNLDALQSYGFTTSSPWKYHSEHFLWLLDYSETKIKNYDHKTITQQKISMMPEKARKMLGML